MVQIWCNTSINEINTETKILKIVNLLGENCSEQKNIVLLYIYDDGRIEKRITIE